MTKYYYSGNRSEEYYYKALALRQQSSTRPQFSRFRGVQRSNSLAKPYKVLYRHKGISYYLGNFADELEAAKAYNNSVLQVIGPYAIINDLSDIVDQEQYKDAS